MKGIIKNWEAFVNGKVKNDMFGTRSPSFLGKSTRGNPGLTEISRVLYRIGLGLENRESNEAKV